MIYFAVGLDVMALLATVSRMIPGMPNLSSISGLLSVLGTVLFVIFLRKLATYIKSDELVQQRQGGFPTFGYRFCMYSLSLRR